jgi:3-phenylpropionate/trans-cinnamate dioxygenase ferredoxin reductase component
MSRSIVVVGAGLAGLRAVEQLRGAGWTDPITVLGTENHLPYNRPPLTKAALQGGVDPTALAFRRRPTTEDVEWRLGTTVTGVDLDGHTVTLQDGSALAYDGLVAASGVSSRRLDLAAPLHWRHAIRTVEDAHALHQQLRPDARVVVVGAGFIGCEVASSARKLGLQVTLHDVAPHPLPALGPELGERCAQLHRDHGVDLKLGAPADLDQLHADVIVVALGAVPNIEWLEGSALTLDRGVVCDATLKAAPHVFAAGDVVTWPHPMADGELIRIEHWTNAAEQGTHAGRNALSAEPKPYEAVPYFWTDQYDVKIQAAGLASRAQRVEMIEPDVAVGLDDDRVVSVVTFNAPRRLMHFRRRIGTLPRLDELMAAA